jgi:hypothetical protein
MTADDLRALRKRLGMTGAAGAALGLQSSTISNYEGARGTYEIPLVVELACETLLRRAGIEATSAIGVGGPIQQKSLEVSLTDLLIPRWERQPGGARLASHGADTAAYSLDDVLGDSPSLRPMRPRFGGGL